MIQKGSALWSHNHDSCNNLVAREPVVQQGHFGSALVAKGIPKVMTGETFVQHLNQKYTTQTFLSITKSTSKSRSQTPNLLLLLLLSSLSSQKTINQRQEWNKTENHDLDYHNPVKPHQQHAWEEERVQVFTPPPTIHISLGFSASP